VLVGGEGTRLQPLTWRTPKQLVPVLGRPLLEHLLLHLRAHGVTHVTLALTRTPLAAAVHEAFAESGALDLTLDYAYEETPLGSGGAIASIAGGWDEPFLVCNGDIITDLDIAAFAAAHRARGAAISIALHEVDDPSGFGVVVLDAASRITRFVEKPQREEAPSRLVNAGTWLFEPSAIAALDPTRPQHAEDELFPTMAASGGPIYGFAGSRYWRDIGNPDAYLRVNLELVAGALPARLPAGWPPDGVLAADGARIAPDAHVRAPVLLGASVAVDAGARIEGPAIVGDGSRVGAGTLVRRSVLWERVQIGPGARVIDCVLADGVHIGAGAEVDGAVVAHGARIADGARVTPGSRIQPDALEGA